MLLVVWDVTLSVSDLEQEDDSCLDGWHVDFDLCYTDDVEEEWDHVRRWDRSYAVVLHDPQGRMQEILARKAVLTHEEKQSLTSLTHSTHRFLPTSRAICLLTERVLSGKIR